MLGNPYGHGAGGGIWLNPFDRRYLVVSMNIQQDGGETVLIPVFDQKTADLFNLVLAAEYLSQCGTGPGECN
ncbi:hypothetical protein DN390_22185 [Bacillus sp. SH7-1]|uniref:hypothetical protein n=1 Tax=Bacillus sp. SH7-1 TaxID=2217818 RepID=UPI0011C7FAFF|nr:hypothetical protein [Bacillus sp. SH7-1]TXR95393.1 hypothetical protein DN390_22185 [Bacillus sp. SH7-1]